MTVRPLRVLSWNVNGLRAMLQRLGMRSLGEFLDSLDADVVCVQETKMTRAELDEELAQPAGYDAFYSFCKIRGGYSGVATFCKAGVPTIAAEEGLTGYWTTSDAVGHVGSIHKEMPPKVLTDLESEGRCVITDHGAFVLINVYCPALASIERLEFKMRFHALLQDRVSALRAANKHVVVLGDINIAHREIDHCDPGPMGGVEFKDQPHRRWMNSFVYTAQAQSSNAESLVADEDSESRSRLVDAFRHFHPNEEKAFTCWNMVTGARQTNFGTRIDYILADPSFLDESITDCRIQPEKLGSDHCPVVMDTIVQLPSSDPSTTVALCTKNFPEFAGTQQTIKTFLQPHRDASLPNPDPPRQASPQRRQRPPQRSITAFFTSSTTPKAKNSTPTQSASPPLDLSFEALEAVGAKRQADTSEWQQFLSGRPPPTPSCYCGQSTVLRSVMKPGENRGRKFYVCTKPVGEKGHPNARCDFFQWADKRPLKKPRPLFDGSTPAKP